MAKAVDHKEAAVPGFEDVASYRDFFSPDEWEAIQFGDWSAFADAPKELVTTNNGRCHTVTVAHLADEVEPYRLQCDRCGDVGVGVSLCQAQAIARLHEGFVAVLVETWSTES